MDAQDPVQEDVLKEVEKWTKKVKVLPFPLQIVIRVFVTKRMDSGEGMSARAGGRCDIMTR